MGRSTRTAPIRIPPSSGDCGSRARRRTAVPYGIDIVTAPLSQEQKTQINDAATASSQRALKNMALFPGIMLSVTVLAMNLLGDGLRDALDPRLARRL